MNSRSIHPLVAAASVAALLSHTPANATASSSASLDSISWTLIDLNLLDGIAASISFTGQSSVGTSTWNSTVGLTAADGATGASVLDPVLASSFDGLSSSTAAVGAASLFSSGHTNGGPDVGSYGTYSGQALMNGWSNTFTLSAYTAVIFTGNATTFATATAAYNSGATSEWAQGQVFITGSIGNGNNLSSGTASFSAYADNWGNGSFDDEGGLLFLTLTNGTSNSLDGSFYGYASSWGESTVTAVPEPETYAMLLVGLGVIGFAGRRRQSGSVQPSL